VHFHATTNPTAHGEFAIPGDSIAGRARSAGILILLALYR
jgi:hypothetical protein